MYVGIAYNVGERYIVAMNPSSRYAALTGQTVLITGASSGIGRATAVAAADAGARVLLAVRDRNRGAAVAQTLRGGLSEHAVVEVDLADLDSICRGAASVTEPVDILVNNAGVSSPTLQHTADGFEMQFGTNHLGHFAWTALLLPRVRSRIVTVASQAERASRLDLDDVNWARRAYNPARAYADSKMANLLFTFELARRLATANSPVTAFAAHPGLVTTAIYDRDPGTRPGVWDRLVPVLGQSPQAGALPVMLAATGELPAGSFTGPRHLFHMRGGAQVIRASKRARAAGVAQRLWDVSEDMTSIEVVV